MTAFQYELLAAVETKTDLDGDGPIGLEIKRYIEGQLQDEGEEDINHGRLYPNLDILMDRGLIEKHAMYYDDRTNMYAITERGKRALDQRRKWL